MKKLLSITFLLLLTACAAPAPAPNPVVEQARRGLTAGDLAAAVWTARPQVWRMRQTAKFSFRGRNVPMIGMMELDTRRNEARLVAINQMGVKLFDLSVREDGGTENYLLPQLARYPRFGEAVAASLRRIFLVPVPAPETGELREAEGGYRLSEKRDGAQVAFLFGGDPVRLVEKSAQGKDQWRVVYLDYRQVAGQSYPKEIVLEDRQAGYRLDLRIDGVRMSESEVTDYEQTEK
jgi:outer membrane biogenesis lipoprotein LolB